MRKTSYVFLAACLLVGTSAFAGNLTLVNGQTTWQSTQCVKPAAPGSVMGAHPDTSGDDMNSLVSQHNAFVDASQAYMNCISDEASQDQTLADQTIISGAKRAISDAQAEIDRSSPVNRRSN